MDIQNVDFERVLKWVLIVLVTGFIAQFGKSLAKSIIQKIRWRRTIEKSEKQVIIEQELHESSMMPSNLDSSKGAGSEKTTFDILSDQKTLAKLRKKASKTQSKQQKKQSK